jgi:hypothetical protein
MCYVLNICCSCRREASFSSPLPEDEPQDYEHDAIVVHMGRFAAETPLPSGQAAAASSSEDTKPAPDQQQQQGKAGKSGKSGKEKRASKADEPGGNVGNTSDGAAAPVADEKSAANLELLFVGSRVQRTQSCKKAASKKVLQVQQLHLYSIASPGMRRWPDNTQDLGAALAWAESVNLKPGWVQLQKGFFQAPGERFVVYTALTYCFC